MQRNKTIWPLLHPFRTQNGNYLYDAKTNEIIGLEDESYMDCLRYLGDLSNIEASSMPPARIEHLVAAGYFEDGLFDSMGPGKCSDCIEEDIGDSLQQLTLEVGTACNLRCAYCVYSAGLEGRRRHGTTKMTQEAALAGVEYLLAHSSSKEHCALGFYGGEPLLDFNLVRFVATEARSRTTRDLHISLTTNGTLFDSDMIKWCIDEKIALLVSLDGSCENHDKNRRTAGGRGTWLDVINSLRLIRDMDEEYFRFHVGVSSVIADNVSPREADLFFSGTEHRDLFEGLRVNATFEDLAGRRNSQPPYEVFFQKLKASDRNS